MRNVPACAVLAATVFPRQCKCCCSCDIVERQPQLCCVLVWIGPCKAFPASWIGLGSIRPNGLLLQHLYRCVCVCVCFMDLDMFAGCLVKDCLIDYKQSLYKCGHLTIMHVAKGV